MSSGKPTPLWRNSSFTLMWASVAASGFGDRILMAGSLVLLGAYATDASMGRVSLNAATQFWFFLPYLVFSFIAGWLADRLPRKWILLSCDELRALLLAGCLVALWGLSGDPVLPVDQRWYVYAVLFLVGTLAATFNPTRNATVPQIVEPRQLPSANALVIGLGVVASMVGALASKFIIDAVQGETIRRGLIIAVAFYAVSGSFFAFLVLRPSRTLVERSDRSFRQAITYVWCHKRIVHLIVLFTAVWGAAMIVYNGALTLGNLHFGYTNDQLFNHYQVMTATIGGGMLSGAGVIALIGTRRESTAVLMLSVIGAGLAIAVFALVPYRVVHFPAAFFVGMFGNVAMINVLSTMQLMSPNYVRGRVMGLNNIVSTIGTVVINGVIWQTPSADTWMRGTLLTTAALVFLIGVVGFLRYMRHGPIDKPGLNILWHVNRLYAFIYHRLRIEGQHHVPNQGAVILASNHTTAIDPVLLQAGLHRRVTWVMLTSFLYKSMNPIWRRIDPIALDRDASDLGKLREVISRLKKGQIVGMFPEGGLQREHRELKVFQPGIGMIARRTGALIVPAWISGTPRSHSIRSHLLTRSRSRVRFGPGFRPESDWDDERIVEELRQRMLALAEQA